MTRSKDNYRLSFVHHQDSNFANIALHRFLDRGVSISDISQGIKPLLIFLCITENVAQEEQNK